MAIPAERRLSPREIRRFGSGREAHIIADLTKIQTESYQAFLQEETAAEKRKDHGLEGVLKEIFPIESYDKTIKLEYLRYELGKPRYGPDECRQLRLTYGRPFRVWLRLTKEQPVEEEVYLGDMPIMIGGGEFIIKGAARVVVGQLHRSLGVAFVVDPACGGGILDQETGEVYADHVKPLTEEHLDRLYKSTLKEVVVGKVKDPLINTSLEEDPTNTHEEALLRIYQRLRPGNPPQLEKAKEL